MDKVVAKREFWTHLEYDEGHTSRIKVNFVFDKFQFEKIRFGSIPVDISDRYLAFYENDTLYIHSIMGGHCYFELSFYEDKDLIFCNEIKKYTKFMSTDSEQRTILFVKSFIEINLTRTPVNERAKYKT